MARGSVPRQRTPSSHHAGEATISRVGICCVPVCVPHGTGPTCPLQRNAGWRCVLLLPGLPKASSAPLHSGSSSGTVCRHMRLAPSCCMQHQLPAACWANKLPRCVQPAVMTCMVLPLTACCLLLLQCSAISAPLQATASSPVK